MGLADFYPVRGQDIEPAKAVCARCPVVADCLEDDLKFAYPYGKIVGVRAGLGAKERSRLRAQLNRGEIAS